MSTKRLLLFVITGLFLILISIPVQAQFKDYSLKYGVHIDGTLPWNEFNNWEYGIKTSYLGRAFIRTELTDFLEADLGVGYGENAGLDFSHRYYKSIMFPIDARLHFSPFNFADWNPYFYAGIGAIYYDNKFLPTSVSPNPVKKFGWSGIVPAGLGFELNLAEGVLLDISGGGAYALTDNLNYFKRGDYLDAHYNLGFGFTFTGDAGNSDNDKDGLTKSEEKQFGTSPDNPDSDNDGLADGDEVNKIKSQPLNSDSDGDGLADGEEANKYHSDPLKSDTDGDGLPDGDEINKYHTDLLAADTDGDGLTDGEEVLKYQTDPRVEDTDADGLSDGAEVEKYKTDPIKSDTDGDGLSDGDEVKTHHTDPLMSDTDRGGINDGKEVARGTNP